MVNGAVSKHSYSSLFGRLFGHISRRRWYQFIVVICLTLISVIFEIISISAVLPFIGIITNPEQVFSSPLMAGFLQNLGFVSADDLVLPLTIAFVAAALVASGLRLLLLWSTINFANAVGGDYSQEVYYRTLYQPYRIHISRGSSEIISGLTLKVGTTISILGSLSTIFTSAVLIVAILITLFIIDPVVAGVSVISLGGTYGIIAWLAQHRLSHNSQQISQEQTQVVKALQEGLGAIRNVLLDNTQTAYCDVYHKAIRAQLTALGENSLISQSPFHIIQAIGMVLIAALAYTMSRQSGNAGAAMPILGAFALGAQRLIPLLSQLYSNWANVAGNRAILMSVLDLLDQPLPEDAHKPAPEPLPFNDSIRFDNISFRYSYDGPLILDGINITIPKGSRIGFVGRTGSGKSTVMDILMFLLEPTHGTILVDNRRIDVQSRRAWQRRIAHVPQSIFLSDTTIAENIAFGIPAAFIDMDRVRSAAYQAHISDYIESQPGGYNALVGERGIRLSGGQRQRIGIARALYKQASILVFDEATSALDSMTEEAVMNAINTLNRDLTILIIAHRITTLKGCDMIIQMEHGKIVKQGAYNQFFSV